jgi:hypothetical protein
MENLLECTICLDKYNSTNKLPRILKCGHTFCTICLKELSRAGNLENSLPFIKCPLDKTIGHGNTNTEEIPINRIIVDLIDYNSDLLFSKLTLQENKDESFQYVNSAKDKLNSLQKYYNNSLAVMSEKTSQLITVKNNCVNEISDYFGRVTALLESKKSELIFNVEKYSKDKLIGYRCLI